MCSERLDSAAGARADFVNGSMDWDARVTQSGMTVKQQNARRFTASFVADRRGFGQSAVVAYALSFGPDFFWNEEHDAVVARAPSKRPTSVEQAVSQLSEETWAEIARDVFGCEPEYLNIETVLQKIEETNTCLSLDSPVEVCIDRDGEFTVLVY